MEGLKDGMVMQRNADDVCEVYLVCDGDPGEILYGGYAEGRVVPESLGGSRWRLVGIPVGGPFSVQIGETTFRDIYVGDVWILAGQSNMAGAGWPTDEDRAFAGDDGIRALYLSNEWRVAHHPLHDYSHAYYGVYIYLGVDPEAVPPLNGVGPGLSFAQNMKRYTGVPQGLLCCAFGGSTMSQWSPGLKEQGSDRSLYAAMARRFEENGSHVRGLFWYQGCSDAQEAVHEAFTENMCAFVRACRRDFGEDLPVVQAQIGRALYSPDEQTAAWWNSIREQQRRMHDHIPRLYTVASIIRELDDWVHMDSDGQRAIGRDAAEAMYHLVFGRGEKACLPPPKMAGYSVGVDSVTGCTVVSVHFDCLHGALTSQGRPQGFEILHDYDNLFPQMVFKTILTGNTAHLHLFVSSQEIAECQLYYGRGMNPSCNISDEAGRPIPTMGPIRIRI